MTMLVLASTDERMPYRTADTRDMELAHRAVLRYAKYLASVAPHIDPSDERAEAMVRAVANALVAMVRALHNAHAELLWPTLRGYLDAAGAATDLLDSVAGKHDELAEGAAAVQHAVGTPTLAAASDALVRTLVARLADVERVALPAAAHYMTERQWRELVDSFIIDLATGERAPMLLGSLLYSATRRERARIARAAAGGVFAAQSYRRAFGRRFAEAQCVLGAERPA